MTNSTTAGEHQGEEEKADDKVDDEPVEQQHGDVRQVKGEKVAH